MKTNITKCLSNNFQVTYQSDFWSVFNFNNAEIEVFENNNSNQIDIFKYKKYCDIVGTNSDIKYFESNDKKQKLVFQTVQELISNGYNLKKYSQNLDLFYLEKDNEIVFVAIKI